MQVSNFRDQMNEAALSRREHKRKSRLGEMRLNTLHVRCLGYTATDKSSAQLYTPDEPQTQIWGSHTYRW